MNFAHPTVYLGRLIDLTHSQDTTTLANYNWVYDQDNRITGFTSKHGTANYSYDDLDQLLNAEYDYQDDENYNYDDNGNRINDGYIIGENNQVLSDGIYNYEYDREGNIISKTDILTGQVTQYQWDHRNRLTSATVNDSNDNLVKSANYTYDALNRRIGKEVDSDGDGNIDETSRFVLDGDHIALTFDGEGNQRERFLHGAGIDQVIAQESDGEVYWALSDNKGTVETVLNNEGDIVNEIIYDAFGNIESETDSNIEFRFGYTGRELDEETGLQYYRARYYDGEIGRFTSQDPIGFLGGDTNLYRYVNNSPLNYIDPSGLFAGEIYRDIGFDDIIIGALGVVGVVGLVGAVGIIVALGIDAFNQNNSNEDDISDGAIIETFPRRVVDDPLPNITTFPVPNEGNIRDYIETFPGRVDDPLPNITTFPVPNEGNIRDYIEVYGPVCSEDDLFIPFLESAAQDLPDLTGQTREQAREELRNVGYEYRGFTAGGYEKWYHPDGSRVQIRPSGEVTRVGPKVKPADGGKKYNPAIGSDGRILRTPEEIHNTGENLID